MGITKTLAGQQVLKDRSVPLSPRQRMALIMFDGKRSMADVLAATAAAGVTAEDLEKLVELGLIEAGAGHEDTAPAPFVDLRSPQERYMEAYPIATQLTAGLGLGLKGLRLNLAVEQATNIDELEALAPRILDAVGKDKFLPLQVALKGH